VWLICSGRAEVAESELATDLDRRAYGAARLHAYHNVLWALVRQEKFEAVLSWGQRAVNERFDDWITVYNMVAASARCGRRADFLRYAKRLTAAEVKEKPSASLSRELLKFEIPRMAQDLELSEARVRKALGVSDIEAVTCA
jgi:hypothetical protein